MITNQKQSKVIVVCLECKDKAEALSPFDLLPHVCKKCGSTRFETITENKEVITK